MLFKRIILAFTLCASILEVNCMKKTELSPRQRDIVLISSNTAKGNMEELHDVLIKTLNNKTLTVNEIKEILVQMYAYCGFPRSLNAINMLLSIINKRKNAGIKDEPGEEGAVLSASVNRNEYGKKVREALTGSVVEAPYMKFTPVIDDYLKEHLFADIFGRGVLSYQEREIATIAALMSRKGVESQLNSHISIGKNIGLSQTQINDLLKLADVSKEPLFKLGPPNDSVAQYFKGQSYLRVLTKDRVASFNVTFEPGCRNNWHIHRGGGQILLCTDGRGYYQEYGKPAQELHPGDVVNIPADVKHWHGAAKDSWFTHIAIEVPAKDGRGSTEWGEEVTDEEYGKLN